MEEDKDKAIAKSNAEKAEASRKARRQDEDGITWSEHEYRIQELEEIYSDRIQVLEKSLSNARRESAEARSIAEDRQKQIEASDRQLQYLRSYLKSLRYHVELGGTSAEVQKKKLTVQGTEPVGKEVETTTTKPKKQDEIIINLKQFEKFTDHMKNSWAETLVADKILHVNQWDEKKNQWEPPNGGFIRPLPKGLPMSFKPRRVWAYFSSGSTHLLDCWFSVALWCKVVCGTVISPAQPVKVCFHFIKNCGNMLIESGSW